MTVRTFVINLDRSPHRRRAIKTRLDELQIPFEWITGTDGLKLTEAELDRYSAREAFAKIGRAMHPNEIGCILSHIGIWQEIVRSETPLAMVIEDDMLIDDDFASLVTDLRWMPPDAMVVNLSWDMAKPVDLQSITAKRSLCRFDREAMRTGSYIIRLEAATRLLDQAFPIRMPVDSLMGDVRHVVPTYGVTPRPVRWDDNMPSDTWTDASMSGFAQSSRESIKGKLLRIANRLRFRT